MNFFRRLLDSAQNANMKASVIGRSISGIDNLDKAIFEFDPVKVEKRFFGDPDRLLEHIVTALKPRGQIRTTTHSIWPMPRSFNCSVAVMTSMIGRIIFAKTKDQ